MNDTLLIAALTESYKRQYALYQSLQTIVQKSLAQVVLSRGDVSGIMESFQKKQELLECIVVERTAIETSAHLWQQRKATIGKSTDTVNLDSMLSRIQVIIQEFLDSEEQLKKYLEHVVKKGNTAS